MIVSAHQPAYNPWLGLLHKILLSDIFVVMDDVQFEKNSFINRNKILQNSNEIMLTIPVKTKEYKCKQIKEIEVLENTWKIKHLKSIEQSYKKAKNFEVLFNEIKKIYEVESKFLIDYTNAYLNFLIKYLNIDTKIVLASDLDIKSKKIDYVIELTKKVGGDIFIFGALGKDYANIEYLNKHNIKAYFQSYNHPQYTQLSNNFHSFMGIIDLLFNVDRNLIIDKIVESNITKNQLKELYV